MASGLRVVWVLGFGFSGFPSPSPLFSLFALPSYLLLCQPRLFKVPKQLAGIEGIKVRRPRLSSLRPDTLSI